MEFTLDDQNYRNYPDEREMTNQAFYQAMRSGKTPRTTQITVSTFLQMLSRILQQGKDILYIGFTSGLSATYERSCMAVQELSEKYPDRKIYAVDSRCASMGEGSSGRAVCGAETPRRNSGGSQGMDRNKTGSHRPLDHSG